MTVSGDEVVWAYRLILGRDPESDAVISAAMTTPDVATMRQNLLSSDEFRQRHRRHLPSEHAIDREHQARKYIRKDSLGIEIGAWFNPLVPRSDGYNSLSLDVYDTVDLRRRAEGDPNISAEQVSRIQDVDLVGSVTEIDTLVANQGMLGKVDYIVSAHNFEHIPNPIRFFQACQKVLKPGGIISMIVPDRRSCFAFLRPRSTTGQFIDAFILGNTQPSPGQIFDHFAMFSENCIDGVKRSGWSLCNDTSRIALANELSESFAKISNNINCNNEYIDAHCWVLTPDVFRSIIVDLRDTGLIQLELLDITEPGTHEFFVHLKTSSSDHLATFIKASQQERTALAYAIATDT